MTFAKVAKVDEVASGTCKSVVANGKKVAIYNVDGKYYATANDCNHKGGPLGEGHLEGEIVTCPWHGAKFDVKTGEPKGPPAQSKLETYPTRISGDSIEVDC